MKIHEFQAKKLLGEYGVPVPRGRVASTPEEAQQVAEELGKPVAVKAQIHAGGRGRECSRGVRARRRGGGGGWGGRRGGGEGERGGRAPPARSDPPRRDRS